MFKFLSKFSEEEINKFHKFIISPYHNTNKNLVKLFKFVSAEFKIDPKKNINKKILFRKLYRTGAYDDVKLRKLISDFYKLLDKFLLQLEIEKNEFRNMILISESNLRYGMINNFFKKAEKIKIIIDYDCVENENQYLDNFIFLRMYESHKNHILDQNDYKGFDQTISNLENFFISAKLTSLIEYLSIKEINSYKKAGRKLEFMDTILLNIENNFDKIKKNHPLIYVKYLSLKMFSNFDDDKYFKLLLSFFESNKNICKGEILNIYTFSVISFSSYKLNSSGNILFYQKIYFNTTDFLIINNYKHLILFNGYITPSGYLCSVTSALALKEYKWAKSFIEDFKEFLVKDSANNVYNFANLIYYHSQKNLDKMHYFLNKINYTIPYYYYNSKIFLIIFHFEKNNIVQLEYEIKNLRSYCNENKKITEEQKNMVLIFLKYIHLLLKCIGNEKNKDKTNLAIFKSKLDKESSVVLKKSWFYEIAEELKKGVYKQNRRSSDEVQT